MQDNSWQGTLSDNPFPRLLLHIWEKKESGRLRIRHGGEEKSLDFVAGDLALAESFFSEQEFPKKLIEARLLSGEQSQEALSHAYLNKMSYSRALVERGILPASRVWDLLADLWLDDIFSPFDWPQADYVFDPGSALSEFQVFLTLFTPEFILRGIRRMKNLSLVEAGLPAETEALQVFSADLANVLDLSASEKYILKSLRHTPSLQEVYGQSQLGKRESQKVLYSFIHLGLAGPSQPKNRLKPSPELSSAELERIWTDFNDKCSLIYKYISKEIGPVALSVLEKTLEEVRSRQGPPLQNIELRTDGRLELKSFPLLSLNLHNEETRRNFLRLLDEVLVAEVLAVKKTLGNAHEAVLVKNLEKIGEPA